MLSFVTALVLAALLTWVMIMVAATLKTRLWTPRGIQLASGNRDNVTEPNALAGRADRAAKNMLENMVLFVTVMAAAGFAGKTGSQACLGATIFFFARLVYWFVYLAGIPYLRTVVWLVGIVGMFIVGLAAVG